MFLPISRSIYCGALSPSALEGHRCTDECLRKDARRLAVLPAGLPELTERLADVLRNYGADFPPFPVVSLLPEADSCDTDFYSPLSLLRGDELDSMLRLSTDMEMLTPSHAFYDALLRAEARWLKLNLEEQITRLRSDNDARVLLLRVLNEVYALGCQVGTDSGAINAALATLYLDLTIVFGFLLRPTDYLDCHDLLCDPHFRRRMLPDEELKYNILRDENRVKALVNGREVRFLEDQFSGVRVASPADAPMRQELAGRLYEELATLIAGLSFVPADRHRLLRGITVLENYLFLLYSNRCVEVDDCFARFSDYCWMKHCCDNLRSRHYGDDRHYADGRSAYDWVEGQINEPCFTFLHPGIALTDSLPRLLRAPLLERKRLYAENYASPFTPVLPGEELSSVSMQPVASGVVNEAEVHRMLAFLYEHSSSWLSQPVHAKRLEMLFCHFLHTNTISTLTAAQKIGLRKGCSEQLYGLFLYYCSKRGVKSEDCAKFLIEVLDTNATLKTFYKNGAHRYIQKYKDFCKENNQSVLQLSSGANEAEG